MRKEGLGSLDDLPPARSYAIASLIYGNSVEALAQGLALGCSLVGKTQYPCILLHTEYVPTQQLSVFDVSGRRGAQQKELPLQDLRLG